MKETRFIALFDLHIGKEYIQTKGEMILQPTHNAAAIEAVRQFSDDFEPHVLLLGGDQINCGPVSHWHNGKPRLTEGFRLKDEMDRLDELVLRPFEDTMLKTGRRKIWLDGNHEAWIQDFLAGNPGVEGLVAPNDYLKLKKRGYELYSQGEIASVGKVHFVHGDVILGKGAANPAAKLVGAYQRNIRAGHLHTYAAHIQESPVDRQDYHSGIIVPSLSNRCPAFIKYNPNKFMNGFLFGSVWENGEFTDHVMVINKNSFSYGGKIYGSKKG